MGLPNPFKAAKKVFKKVAKPFRKISQKFIPKELRWAAPYLAAVAPYSSFMMPAAMANNAVGRTLLSSLYNIGAQGIADPEGDDVNLLSTLLAGGQGYLTTPGEAGRLMGATTRGKEMAAMGDYMGPPDMAQALQDRSLLTTAKDIGLTGASKLASLAEGAGTTLGSLTSNPSTLFTVEGAKKGLTALSPALSQGTGDVAKAMGDKAMRDWEAQEAADAAEIEATSTANEQEQADLTMKYYRQAGHDEETIQEALEINGLGGYYEPPVTAANGGIIGLKHGGMLNFGGREMDLRTGGFVPIGKKEKADDVPARLSKNEFVMTADAVRAAGGGDVNKGAQRMYNVMNNLEARA
jgi:hypothetical protein